MPTNPLFPFTFPDRVTIVMVFAKLCYAALPLQRNLTKPEKTVTSGHGRKIKGLYGDMTVTRCDRTET
jgi:hypothetical protein